MRKAQGSFAQTLAMEAVDEQHPDLTVFVQNLLKEMQGRFQTMSDAVINRIDDMGERIDELDKSISELMSQAGVEELPSDAGNP